MKMASVTAYEISIQSESMTCSIPSVISLVGMEG